jgi:hypothetical protein
VSAAVCLQLAKNPPSNSGTLEVRGADGHRAGSREKVFDNISAAPHATATDDLRFGIGSPHLEYATKGNRFEGRSRVAADTAREERPTCFDIDGSS